MFFHLFVCIIHLNNRGSNIGLDEVVLHESLEVEIGKGVVLRNLEESGELGIRDDLATVLLVLKGIGADVVVDLAADGSAGHLGSKGLSKENGKLVADASRLDESTWLSVSRRLAGLLERGLLGVLALTGKGLLDGLVFVLQSTGKGKNLLDLVAKFGEFVGKGGLRGFGLNRNLDNNRLDSRSDFLRSDGLGLLLLGGLLGGDIGGRKNNVFNSGGSGNGSRFIRNTDHSNYTFYIPSFLYYLTH